MKTSLLNIFKFQYFTYHGFLCPSRICALKHIIFLTNLFVFCLSPLSQPHQNEHPRCSFLLCLKYLAVSVTEQAFIKYCLTNEVMKINFNSRKKQQIKFNTMVKAMHSHRRYFIPTKQFPSTAAIASWVLFMLLLSFYSTYFIKKYNIWYPPQILLDL